MKKRTINIGLATLQVLIAIGLFIGIYFTFDIFNKFVLDLPNSFSIACESCIETGQNPWINSVPLEIPNTILWIYILPAILLIIGIYFLINSIKNQ